MRYAQYISLTLIILALLACGGGGSSELTKNPTPQPEPDPVERISFSDPVLSNVVINKLRFINTTKLGASNSGVYKFIDDQWTLQSSSTWVVFDIAIISASNYIASIQVNNTFQLAQSTDAGNTWEFISHDFGGPTVTPGLNNEKIQAIVYEPRTGILYASGYSVLASSNDEGRTWQKLSGTWQGLARGAAALTLNDANQSIWFGGQGAIENPILQEYSSVSNSTQSHNDAVSALLPIPSTIEGIVIHPDSGDVIFASGEGGIIKTENGGDTWAGVLLDDSYRFYYSLIIHPSNTDTMYTAGWSKDINTTQPLVLELTDDGGQTWQAFTHPDNTLYGGVRSMQSEINENDEFLLYFALQNGGIVQVSVTD